MTLSAELISQIEDDLLDGKSPTRIAKARGVSRSQVYVIRDGLFSGNKGALTKRLTEHAHKTGDDLSLFPQGIRLASILKSNGIVDSDEADNQATYLESWLKSRGEDIDAKTAIEAKVIATEMAASLGVPSNKIVPKLAELKASYEEIKSKFAVLRKATASATARYEQALALEGLVIGFIEKAKRFDNELRRRGKGIEIAPMLIEMVDILDRTGNTIFEVLAYLHDFKAKENERREHQQNIQLLKAQLNYYWGVLQSHKEHAKETIEFYRMDIDPEDLAMLRNEATRRAMEKGMTEREAFHEIAVEAKDNKGRKERHYPSATGPSVLSGTLVAVSPKTTGSRPIPLTASAAPSPEEGILVTSAQNPYVAVRVPAPENGMVVVDPEDLA